MADPPPFSRCWPAYAALWAANRRLTGETPEKQKEQSSSFSGVSVRGGCAGAFTRWVFFRPQGTGDGLSLSRRKQKPRVGTHSEPAACVRDWAKPQTRCVNCSPQVWAFSPPGKTGAQRGRAPGNNRVRARRGEERDTERVLPTAGVLGAAAGSPCIRVAEYGMLRARQNRQSSRNSLRGRADAPVPWKGPGDICARPCVCR